MVFRAGFAYWSRYPDENTFGILFYKITTMKE